MSANLMPLTIMTELEEVKAELAALKEAIKRTDATYIVDGGDFYDHGWLVQADVNRECQKKFGKILSEV